MLKSNASSKKRSSSSISLAAARNTHHAIRYAEPVIGKTMARWYKMPKVVAGKPLNLWITINWKLTDSGIDRFAELRNQRLCPWLRSRSKQHGERYEPTYVYVKEAGHVHWLLHLPEHLIAEFEQLLPRWITSLERKGTGPRKRAENLPPTCEGAVDIQRTRNSVAVSKYMLKGIEPAAAVKLGIKSVSPEGIVIGRRTGVSRNLGKGARQQAGYKPRSAPWRWGLRLWQRGPGDLQPVPRAVSSRSTSPLPTVARLLESNQ